MRVVYVSSRLRGWMLLGWRVWASMLRGYWAGCMKVVRLEARKLEARRFQAGGMGSRGFEAFACA